MISDESFLLFKRASKELPAYKKHLVDKGYRADYVKSKNDFKQIPITSKKDYLRQSNHKDLVWSNDWVQPLWFCATSGSTGEPYYFPRNDKLAEQASRMAEEFLGNSSHTGSTLVLMGFGMGVWIGGLITLNAFEIAAKRTKAPVAFLPTGYNKIEIFKALKKLSPEFDQTILAGYPPFIKEVIDEAPKEGIDLSKLNLRLMFAAEAFTETFRNYVCEHAGIKEPLLDTLNIYGTADVGAMAHETPLSILVRRLALEDPNLYKDMFRQIEKTPTLAQYRPEFIDFEEVDGELLLTADAALPLIRYAVGDNGGIFSYSEIESLLGRYGIDLTLEAKKAGISHTVSKRPFVFVYERTDLSTTLHGIIIYPEFVKEGLLKDELAKIVTGRFTMSTKHDIRHNQFLQINVELRNHVDLSDSLTRKIQKIIRETMIDKSSEFSEVSKSQDSAKLVHVILWQQGHPRYFAPGTKQKWVEKA